MAKPTAFIPLIGCALLALASASVAAPLSIQQLTTSARSGDAEAAYQLGRAYNSGDGVAADSGEAERWLANAARLGHRKAGAEYGLILLHEGKPREALPWLKEGAARGDSRAQYGLATLLFNGGPVPADPAEARRWMRRAAKAGLPAAAEALAIMENPAALAPPKASYEIVTVEAPPARADKPAVPATAPAKASVARPGGWSVQLGAFANPDNARRLGRLVQNPSHPEASFPVVDGLTRVRVGPFPGRAEAQRYCDTQRRRKRDCLEVRAE